MSQDIEKIFPQQAYLKLGDIFTFFDEASDALLEGELIGYGFGNTVQVVYCTLAGIMCCDFIDALDIMPSENMRWNESTLTTIPGVN
jgi:hypothetical protein